jgi:serine/threonine protein kinase
MPLDHWQRAKEVFAAAVEHRREDRQTFVSRACADDKILEREVNLLLQHHESSHEFLDTPLLRLDECFPEGRLPILSEGSRFGKYTVLRRIGSGGMGDVYLAEDTRLYRRVALKLLASWSNLDTDSVARFQQEALAASTLNHPNVPVVYEADEVDGQHYIATEFVEGMNLSERIARGRLGWPEAVSIAIQVGRALAAAHVAGIIHRDVKPSNILLREDGTVKLADFGIAKLLEQTSSVPAAHRVTTAVGALIGTPAYMSPEQFSGQSIDARTDVWSLAAVLHEMIVGSAPSASENLLRGSPLCAPVVWKAVGRALERDQDRRYKTVQEFTAVLESAIQSRRPRGRSGIRYARSGAVAGLLSLLVMASYLVVRLRRAPVNAEPFRVDRVSKLTSSGKAIDTAISPDGRYVLYIVNDSGRYSIRLRELTTGSDAERIGASDVIYSNPTFAPDSNTFYYLADEKKDLRTLYRAPLIEGTPSKVIEDVDSPVTVSPDGRQIEFGRGRPSAGDTALFVASADGTGLRQIVARPYALAFLFGGACWSADGKSIFTGALVGAERAAIIKVQISNGSQTQLSRSTWRWVGRVNSISDGHGLMFPAAEVESISPQIYQLSLNENKVSAITADLARYMKASASARGIVTVQEDRQSAIWLNNLKDSSQSRRITPLSGGYWQLAWLPDGSLLSQTGAGRELNIWRIFQDGSRQRVTTGPHIDWNTVVSPDGKHLAFVSNRAGGLHLWTGDPEGHFLRQLTTGEGRISSPSFTPDGSIVYCETNSGSATILKIPAEGGTPVRVLPTEARKPVVSPDGKFLACELKDRKLGWQTSIVDLQTARVFRTLPDIPYDDWLRWTPDGRALAYIATQNGVSNIAAKVLVDGSEKRLTKFGEETIFSFDMARNGREIALIRGIVVSDIVLLEGIR